MEAIQNEIEINASVEKVWDLLTNPAKSPEYMYTCAIETDFKEGSTILWRGIHDQVVYVSGILKEYKPLEKMVYTVIDPNADYPKTPENHLTVTYVVSETENGTHFKVTQAGYETVAEGQARYDEAVAGGGWSSVLEKIKEMAESKS